MKTAEGGEERGYDAGKKVFGRKRHILVDTLGLVMAVAVHSAAVQDRDGATKVASRAELDDQPHLELIWADSAYTGSFVDWAEENFNIEVAIVTGRKEQKGFEVQPHRWIVERTLAWISRYRRLAKDYERVVAHSEAFIYVAMIGLMLQRAPA